MSERIITISREFGSGGRTVGRMAAKARNYHIALDSGVLGIERCAELLTQLY